MSRYDWTAPDDLDPFTGERVPCVVCGMAPQRGGSGCCSPECVDSLHEWI